VKDKAVDPEATTNINKTLSQEKKAVLYVEDKPANLNLVCHIFHRPPDVLLLTTPDAKPGIELAKALRMLEEQLTSELKRR